MGSELDTKSTDNVFNVIFAFIGNNQDAAE